MQQPHQKLKTEREKYEEICASIQSGSYSMFSERKQKEQLETMGFMMYAIHHIEKDGIKFDLFTSKKGSNDSNAFIFYIQGIYYECQMYYKFEEELKKFKQEYKNKDGSYYNAWKIMSYNFLVNMLIDFHIADVHMEQTRRTSRANNHYSKLNIINVQMEHNGRVYQILSKEEMIKKGLDILEERKQNIYFGELNLYDPNEETNSIGASFQ